MDSGIYLSVWMMVAMLIMLYTINILRSLLKIEQLGDVVHMASYMGNQVANFLWVFFPLVVLYLLLSIFLGGELREPQELGW